MYNNLGSEYRKAGDLEKARDRLETAKRMMLPTFTMEKGEQMAKVRGQSELMVNLPAGLKT